jgi:hypothetical protein
MDCRPVREVGQNVLQPGGLWEDISPGLKDAARLTLCSTDDYGTDNWTLAVHRLGRDPARSQPSLRGTSGPP